MSKRLNEEMESSAPRRLGDQIQIDGSYQYKALHEGPAFQRAWHREKLLLIDGVVDAPSGARQALDAGCGSGVLAAHLASKGWGVTGVDANESAIKFASETFDFESLRFVQCYLDELDAGEGFDLAISFEVIEHLTYDQVLMFLQSLRESMRAGGRVVLTTPNYLSLWPIIEWLCDRFSFLPNMDGDQHITRFNQRRLRKCLKDSGFTVDRIRSFSTLSPFVGIVSQRAQRSIHRLERLNPIPLGNILVVEAHRK